MIGEKLKQLRTERHLSQKTLGYLLDTSSGYISEIEQGKKMPGSDFLISLKRELGVSLDWLLMGEVGDHQLLFLVGKRIEHYRMMLRYKPTEFANIIGIQRDVLRDIENQKITPSKDIIESIIKNTDISPLWLTTGEGPIRKNDSRTGDGRPFFAYKEQENGEHDRDLMWEISNNIQNILMKNGEDPQAFSHDKRVIIQDLLYTDAMSKDRQVDIKYAELLLSLARCEVCGDKLLKKKWQEKWGIIIEPGTDLNEASILVKAAPGLKCPMEGMLRNYITDSKSVRVHCTDYYRRLVDDGSLILASCVTKKVNAD